jgi:hypothetical protein
MIDWNDSDSTRYMVCRLVARTGALVPFRSPQPVGGSPLKALKVTTTWCHEREEYLVAALRHDELNNLLAISSNKAC